MRNDTDIQAILSNTKYPKLLTELNLRLKDILNCVRSICKDVCYAYIPQYSRLHRVQKSIIYKELNKSIVLYDQKTVDEVKTMLAKLIEKTIYIPKNSLILTIDFKTKATRYRYIMVYPGTSSIKMLTPESVLSDIRSVHDAVNIIVKDIVKHINVEELVFLRITVPLDSDKLSIKFRCFFNHSNIELLVLDSVLLMFYVGKLLTEHTPQA